MVFKVRVQRPRNPRVCFNLVLSLVVMSSLITSSPSFGYIPPSQFLMKTWFTKHSGKNIKISSSVNGYEGTEQATGSISFKETLHFHPQTKLLRSLATDETGKKLFSLEKNLDTLAPIAQFLLGSDFKEVSLLLKSRGVPIKTDEDFAPLKTEPEKLALESESLGRWQGKVAWVIGPTGQDLKVDTGPQLWFEKDSFLPLRLIYLESKDPNSRSSSLVEFQFDQYKITSEFAYPRIIHVLKNKKKIFSVQLLDMTVESEKLGHLPKSLAENSSPEGVMSLIQLYYDTLR